ncbi:MAG: hypothetical protein ABH860_01170, partial [bacterium]
KALYREKHVSPDVYPCTGSADKPKMERGVIRDVFSGKFSGMGARSKKDEVYDDEYFFVH